MGCHVLMNDTSEQVSTGTVLYRSPADDAHDALNLADNWLSMFLRHWDPAYGEDYDLDRAEVAPDGTDEETGETVFAVRVPVTYTERTNPTLIGYLV